MTTASELKRAAVVEIEKEAGNEVSESEAVKAVASSARQMHNATELKERCSPRDDTSFRFSTSISPSYSTISITDFCNAFSPVGSTTASANLSLFSTQDFPTQQNPVPLWRNQPERAFHAIYAN